MSKLEQIKEKMLSGKKPELISMFHDIRERVLSVSDKIEEEAKWSMPHYNYKGLMIGIGVFKNHMGIWFHKGTLINDKYKLLRESDNKKMVQIHLEPGDTISDEQLSYYVNEAIKINEKGLKIEATKKVSSNKELVSSERLIAALEQSAQAKDFYQTLTPKMKSNFCAFIEEAKQEATKEKRVLRVIDRLEQGLKTTH